MSFALALLMISALALLHSDGMSSMFGGSDSCSIVSTCGMEGRGRVGLLVCRWDVGV